MKFNKFYIFVISLLLIVIGGLYIYSYPGLSGFIFRNGLYFNKYQGIDLAQYDHVYRKIKKIALDDQEEDFLNKTSFYKNLECAQNWEVPKNCDKEKCDFYQKNHDAWTYRAYSLYQSTPPQYTGDRDMGKAFFEVEMEKSKNTSIPEKMPSCNP